jgi:hypothetical protein
LTKSFLYQGGKNNCEIRQNLQLMEQQDKDKEKEKREEQLKDSDI